MEMGVRPNGHQKGRPGPPGSSPDMVDLDRRPPAQALGPGRIEWYSETDG
jgi:hypothetical protein